MLAFIISPKRQTLLELSSTYLRGSPSNKHKPQKKKVCLLQLLGVELGALPLEMVLGTTVVALLGEWVPSPRTAFKPSGGQ